MVGHFSRVSAVDFQLLNRSPQSEVENRLRLLTDQMDAKAQCGAMKGAAGAQMKRTEHVARRRPSGMISLWQERFTQPKQQRKRSFTEGNTHRFIPVPICQAGSWQRCVANICQHRDALMYSANKRPSPGHLIESFGANHRQELEEITS